MKGQNPCWYSDQRGGSGRDHHQDDVLPDEPHELGRVCLPVAPR